MILCTHEVQCMWFCISVACEINITILLVKLFTNLLVYV